MDPTIVNGGIINSYSKNNRYGKGKWMVVEADESDGSFLKLPHQISIITNIDVEHLDFLQKNKSYLKHSKISLINYHFTEYVSLVLMISILNQ